MNIGIYGPSIALYDEGDPNHFITLLKKYYKGNIVSSGVAQCSEERVLFELKKNKKLDLAIIIHCAPYNIFVPSWSRDITNIDKDTFKNKIDLLKWLESINIDPEEMYDSLDWFSRVPYSAVLELLKHYGYDITEHRDVAGAYLSGNNNLVREKFIETVKKAKDDINYYCGLFDALMSNKKYLSHPDLTMNRYYGALIQIDQYLENMNIPCVHLLDKQSWYPKWFRFKSGPTDNTLAALQRDPKYFVGYKSSSNAVSTEGNRLIFNKIVELATSSIAGNASGDQSEDGGSIPPVAPERSSND